ncbi:deoxynucleoside kinase [Rhodonellum psychrophilum GCM71 = DSM 17998]|uniref:Deoxynucleoside kinase n=2 Tax=Rhodonellum TaxID=336827 RepID=U5BPV1_9BACT|nr:MULTISPECIES: deoxynucleoside kinase [Rhodonellum]ERM82600.1 deoxynucleoside kinase [Rhodonellum psychrophilum GCM71 = DSM 17998]MDO9553907.1 deoxynucleoside kinase [Rhodonellum sp.]SDZ53455.1 Deoxyadenosine/deoxycytidine kinase [Rhodonellum ikkaensis]
MHIAVSGNIGSGKTTLTEKLARHYGWKAEFEAVDNNPYLADFYEDMKRWSFHLQVYFLNSRFNQITKIRQSEISVIQDRTIYEDAYIFAANLHKSKLISERDYENYLSLFNSMINLVKAPDLLIYLKADIPKLVGQIEKRGREYENSIRIDYLKNLNTHYEDWIGSYDKGKLLIVDVNDLDFVANPEDFSAIVGRVDVEIHGLFS